jgi:hypothetical protein
MKKELVKEIRQIVLDTTDFKNTEFSKQLIDAVGFIIDLSDELTTELGKKTIPPSSTLNTQRIQAVAILKFLSKNNFLK